MDPLQARTWLSEPRFGVFLIAADHDHERAVALHEWHADMSNALFAAIRMFEVLLRNSIDRALGAGQPQAPLHQTWLFDLGILQPIAVKQVVVAVERLGRREPTRSGVVAMLPFGFWASLFGRRYDVVWQTTLHRAFPHTDCSRVRCGAAMREIHLVRNRIAHHDSLLGQDVERVLEEMLAVARWIDPKAAAWLRRAARVEEVATRRP